MNKNIDLMLLTIFTLCLSATAFGEDETSLCQSGRYQCQQMGPGYVVAYPIDANSEPKKEAKYKSIDTDRDEFNPTKKDLIEVDLNNLSWSAYNNEGEFVRGGHVSGGKEYCADIDSECTTVTGTFAIFRKGDEDCKSTKFPVGRGGAPMPYCMFFHGGYALHGSNSVPNYNASHGCVRMSPEDAQWLNEEFVNIGHTRVNIHY